MDARFKRKDPRAGFTSGKRLSACRHCAGALPANRRSFCSDECVHEWKIRTQPSYAAIKVKQRDKGVCRECGLDCIELAKRLGAVRWRDRAAWEALIAEHGLTGARAEGSRRLWEMDHIIPVVEGGGSCGLDNLRTLCFACHRKATKELAGRRAQARRAAIEAAQNDSASKVNDV